jgi:hypothetical protein
VRFLAPAVVPFLLTHTFAISLSLQTRRSRANHQTSRLFHVGQLPGLPHPRSSRRTHQSNRWKPVCHVRQSTRLLRGKPPKIRTPHYSTSKQGSMHRVRCCRVVDCRSKTRNQMVQGMQELSSVGELWNQGDGDQVCAVSYASKKQVRGGQSQQQQSHQQDFVNCLVDKKRATIESMLENTLE